MKHMKVGFCIGLVALFLNSGCGHDDSKEKDDGTTHCDAAKRAGTAPTLASPTCSRGFWISPCECKSGKCQTQIRSFDEPSSKGFEFTTVVYSDQECKERIYTIDLTGNYEESKVETTINRRINYSVTKATATITSEDFLDEANKTSFFGYNSWHLDTEKSIASRSLTNDATSEKFPSSSETLYDLFAISGDVLTFGKLPEGTIGVKSETERPTELDAETSFTFRHIPQR